jgi:hypothetical protein
MGETAEDILGHIEDVCFGRISWEDEEDFLLWLGRCACCVKEKGESKEIEDAYALDRVKGGGDWRAG